MKGKNHTKQKYFKILLISSINCEEIENILLP